MKREDLNLVKSEQFRTICSWWCKTEEESARFERIAKMRDKWNALDVLDLEDVSMRDKLWLVLRVAFLPDKLLHEFACRCAEWALSLVDSPDPRSFEVIRVKRRWIAGEATDSELDFAQAAAVEAVKAAVRDALWDVVEEARLAAACASDRPEMGSTGRYSAWAAANHATHAAIYSTEWEHEVEILRNLINEWEE